MVVFVGTKDKDGFDVEHHVIIVDEAAALKHMTDYIMKGLRQSDVEWVNIRIGKTATGYPF